MAYRLKTVPIWTTLLALGLAGCTMSDLAPRPSESVGVDRNVATSAVMPLEQISEPSYATNPAATVVMTPPTGPVIAPPAPLGAAPKPSNTLAPSVAAAVGISTPSNPLAPPAALGTTVAPTITAPKAEKPSLVASLASRLNPGNLLPGFGKSLSGSEAANRRKLKSMGVQFEDIDAVGRPGKGRCGIAHPVKVSAIGSVEVKPAAILNSEMAVAFAEWVREDVVPAARTRYLSGVNTIHQMSSYSCRTIGNKRGGRLSEHSFGNAIDIGKVSLNNGKDVVVKKPAFFALRESSLLKEIRTDACRRFTTVLGPGYDRAHADHFHFDLMTRRGTTCK